MGSPFRSLKIQNRKVAKPSKAAILRAARAIVYPEAGDPLPEPGSLLEKEAHRFVEFMGRQEERKLRESKHAQSA